MRETAIDLKYERGTFIVVPSRDLLKGLHPTAQCLYMWLCAYANETNQCFPSRSRLSKDVGCSTRTIDSMLGLLVERGLVRKESRFNDNEQKTNNYTVMVGGSAGFAPPRADFAPPPVQDLRTELKPYELKPITIAEPPAPPSFSFDEYLEEMRKNKGAHIRFIAFFFKKKNLRFDSKAEIEVAIKRHLRAARDVTKFGEAKVNAAVRECERMKAEDGIEWTIETILKVLTK